ncbi:MAG: DarT ssDNA thymidine ADP-ribosyltransferase family protein [Candidatus Promineifilaceae bacterium]
MVSRKPDAPEIGEFLNELTEEDWVRRNERRWWPQFLFHYTDLLNAVNILQDGYLYSRESAESEGKLRVSSGSPNVLDSTALEIKRCVRLYFRPKTPTQFHVEGIRSSQILQESKFPAAHCPVMIFFLFDAGDFLTRVRCEFSDGNLGSSKARRLSTASELRSLPWKKIYHQGPFDRSRYEEADISFRRSAEVIVPNRLSLSALKYIYCRSAAEKETLLHLLPQEVKQKYQPRIISTTRNLLFFRQHTFVETVRLSATSARFHFSPETKSPGPFHLQIEVISDSLDRMHIEQDDFYIDLRAPLEVNYPAPAFNYRMRLKLDQHIAYENRYFDQEIPF